MGNITGSSANNLGDLKGKVYSVQFLMEFYANSITNLIANDNWTGDVMGLNSTVYIPTIPNVTVSASTNNGDVSLQGINASNIELRIDYAFNGGFYTTDIDRGSISADLNGALVNKLVNKLRLAVESTILGAVYLSAGAQLSSATEGAWATSDNCVKMIAKATAMLSTGSGDGLDVAPGEGRYLLIHPMMKPAMIIQTAFAAMNAGTPKSALYTGYVGNVANLEVLESPLVPGAGTVASPYHGLVGHPEALTVATKFMNVQADYVMPDVFGVATRAQNFFGFKVVNPSLLIDMSVYL